jgi:hypothetical protein
MKKYKTGKILIFIGIALMIIFGVLTCINLYFDDNIFFSMRSFDIIVHSLSYVSLILVVLGIGLSILKTLNENVKLIHKYNEIFNNIDISNYEIKEQVSEIKTETLFIEHIKLLNESIKNTTGRLNYDSIQYNSLNGNDYYYHAFKKLKSDFSKLMKNRAEIMAITFQAIEKGEIEESHLNELKKCTLIIYEHFYNEQKNSLLFFYSTLQSIFMFIKQLPDEQKQKTFLKNLSLHLTSEELGLLFYHELRNANKKDSNYLWLDAMYFFSDIDEEALIQPWIQYKFYPKTKFDFLNKSV